MRHKPGNRLIRDVMGRGAGSQPGVLSPQYLGDVPVADAGVKVDLVAAQAFV
jgi:hypothetical protein